MLSEQSTQLPKDHSRIWAGQQEVASWKVQMTVTSSIYHRSVYTEGRCISGTLTGLVAELLLDADLVGRHGQIHHLHGQDGGQRLLPTPEHTT